METQAFELLKDMLKNIDKRLDKGAEKFTKLQKEVEKSNDIVRDNTKKLDSYVERFEILEAKVIDNEQHVKFVRKVCSIIAPSKKKVAYIISLFTLFFLIIKFSNYITIKM